jgi:hypothetical protein
LWLTDAHRGAELTVRRAQAASGVKRAGAATS